MKKTARRYSEVLGVVPARFGSVRLPGKPLASILGRPMVQWVYEAARAVLPRVIVATDDARIAEEVHKFGGEVMMTPSSCASGTERMAHVARKVKAAYYVNIQGDEPLMNRDVVRKAVDLALKHKAIATVATDLAPEDRTNPNAVKVVLGNGGRALYFSRSLVPFPRDGESNMKSFKHLGLYVYPRKDLFQFVASRPTELENTEKLEQLRALYYDMPIFVALTKYDSIGVDTESDLKAVEEKMRSLTRVPTGK